MTNAYAERANAETMPASSPSRRALLRAALAASAVAAVPAVALGADRPDAALLALQPEVDASDRVLRGAEDRGDRASKAVFARRPAEPTPPAFDFSAAYSPPLVEKELLRFDQAKRAYEQAHAAWKADYARIKEECGLPEADAAVEAAAEAVCVLSQKIAGIQAKTVEGLIFKARYAASHNVDEYDEAVMTSIVDDLIAMGGNA